MAIISSFLCWSNTRTGSIVCGYYTLVMSGVCLAFYMLKYIAVDDVMDSIEMKGIVYAGFILYSFMIGVSLILLPGVYMDRKFLFLPWIYVLVIMVLYESGAIALITTIHLEQDHRLQTWDIISMVFYFIRLIANCYGFACVVSQYQELSEGRGTYEFLYKPHQMARVASLSDIEEYQPPFGASLPPYSEENPYKEYSPPNYENVASEYEDINNYTVQSRDGNLGASERSRSEISSLCLNNTTADVTGSSNNSETFSERGDGYNYPDITYQNLSSNESLEHIMGYPSEEIPQHFPGYYTSHTSVCTKQQDRNKKSCNEDVIAMTVSSCLMNYSPDCISPAGRSYIPHRSKFGSMSPLLIQKRTYITWL